MDREEERRTWTLERLEVRAEGDAATDPNGAAVIEGYAAVFGALSLDLGGWRERIAPGAFTRSVAENDVRALWDHNSLYVLGRNRAGTLELAEDERGLGVEIRPPATTWAGDLLASMKRGDVNQMSFGFYVRQDEWLEEDGMLVRVLRDVDLFDVSVVTYPAYPQTSAEARKRAEEGGREKGEVGSVKGEGGSEGKKRPGPADDEESKRASARARLAARRRDVEIKLIEV